MYDVDLNQGTDILTDAVGTDTISFVGSAANVTFSLGSIALQNVNGTEITLSSATTFDNLIGGDGNDTLTGNAGVNTLTGGGGNDTYVFDADTALGTDTLNETGGGIDTLDFSATTTLAVVANLGLATSQTVNVNLTLILGSAAAFENVIGGQQNDTLTGNSLSNILAGGAGNDKYVFDADSALGSDTIDESGGGIDTLDFSTTTTLGVAIHLGLTAAQVVNQNLTLTLSAGNEIENANGSALADTLTGNSLANVLTGNAGNDTYNFSTDSALGADTLSDSAGIDTLDFSGTTDRAVAVNLGLTTAQVVNTNLTLTLGSVTAFENIVGGTLGDTLTGNANANVLTGGSGSDVMNGAAGNDTYLYDVDSNQGTETLSDAVGTDTISFVGSAANVTFDLGLTSAQSVNGTVLTLSSGTAFDNLTGGDGNDTLTGNAGVNTLIGGAGNDTLAGAAGNDIYSFNADTPLGSDSLTDAVGTETISFVGSVADVALNLGLTTLQVVNGSLTLTLASGTTFENLIGGDGNDVLTGNAGVNSLTGGLGADTLDGSSGNDTLTGGAGDDTLIGGPGDDVYAQDTDAANGTDTIDESGGGLDTLDFTLTTTQIISVDLSQPDLQVVTVANQSLILGSGTTIENVKGGSLADVLTGNSLANTLTGNGGDDTLNGGDGDDLLIGNAGNDTLNGGPQNDVYQFDADAALGSDTINDTNGMDALDFALTTTVGISLDLAVSLVQALHATKLSLTLPVGTVIETVLGTAKDDTIRGNDADNILVGNAGNDLLQGRAGRDILIGGLGADTLDGGDGDDVLIGGKTNNDALITNLNAIRTEWTSGNVYTARIANLRAGVGSPVVSLKAKVNVLNDSTSGAVDSLDGGNGEDWFFKAVDDVITDLFAEESLDLL